MPRLLSRAVLAAGLLALVLPAAARDEKPKRVEIGKRAKAATAFVDVPGAAPAPRSASTRRACSSPTSTSSAARRTATVTLVLDPSLETQRVFKAKVVRTDKDTDLALLRAEA